MYIDAPGNRPPNFTVPKGNVTDHIYCVLDSDATKHMPSKNSDKSAACMDGGIDNTYCSIEEPTGPYGNSGNS